MIVLRLPTITHFRVRSLEWGMGALLLSTGLVLAQPAPTFVSPIFHQMERIAPEWAWALAALLVAIVRLGALWRNGAWEPTPWIRGLTALASALFFLQITLGVLSASTSLPLILAWVPGFVAADLYSVFRAAQDVALSREARRLKPEAPVIVPVPESAAVAK